MLTDGSPRIVASFILNLNIQLDVGDMTHMLKILR